MKWLILPLLFACGTPEDAPVPGVWSDDELEVLRSLRQSDQTRPDPTNRFADNAQAAALGQALYFDPGMSPNAITCASCHDPALGFGDGKTLATGVGTTDRHSPNIPGNQFGAWFFWDGRADSLWAQATGPIESAVEMGSDRVFVAHHIAAKYAEPYEALFGPLPDLAGVPARGRPDGADPEGTLNLAWQGLSAEKQAEVTGVFANAAKAIAAYERKLIPTAGPFDRYIDAVLAGDPSGGGHLDEDQVRGLSIFLREGNCTSCHLGPNLTDRAFHNLGLPVDGDGYDQGRTRGAMLVQASEFNCAGPYSDAESCPELEVLNPTFQDFVAAFKTPSLRNVAQTAPYMHDGAFETLSDVLAFYNELPGEPAAGHRELTLQPLKLEPEQLSDLEAFLQTLTGDPMPKALISPPEG